MTNSNPFERVDELERELKTLKDKVARLEAFVEIDRLSAPAIGAQGQDALGGAGKAGTLHLPPRGKH